MEKDFVMKLYEAERACLQNTLQGDQWTPYHLVSIVDAVQGRGIADVRGSVCFVLKFAFPPSLLFPLKNKF